MNASQQVLQARLEGVLKEQLIKMIAEKYSKKQISDILQSIGCKSLDSQCFFDFLKSLYLYKSSILFNDMLKDVQKNYPNKMPSVKKALSSKNKAYVMEYIDLLSAAMYGESFLERVIKDVVISLADVDAVLQQADRLIHIVKS